MRKFSTAFLTAFLAGALVQERPTAWPYPLPGPTGLAQTAAAQTDDHLATYAAWLASTPPAPWPWPHQLETATAAAATITPTLTVMPTATTTPTLTPTPTFVSSPTFTPSATNTPPFTPTPTIDWPATATAFHGTRAAIVATWTAWAATRAPTATSTPAPGAAHLPLLVVKRRFTPRPRP